MFTKWSEIEDWIRDNSFVHWVITSKKPDERDDKSNDKIIDSNYYAGDFEDKLAMTHKYLQMHAGKVLYGVAYKTPGTNVGGTICEIRLEPEYAQPQGSVAGIGGGYPSIGELTDTITKQVKAELEAQRYKDERAAFEKEKKEFEQKEQAVWGLIVNKVGPAVLGNILGGKGSGRLVAGIDAEAPVHTDPLQPIVPDKGAEEQELVDMADVFTDEESEKLFDLMRRFKAVEPEHYLTLIEKMVTMAEEKSGMYETAKSWLLK